jgi:hypothetical protein
VDVAALVVSVVALILSGGSVVYARLQGVESRRLRQIESSRRHDELTPVLLGEVESVNGGSWFRLWLSLLSATPLLALELEIVEGPGVSFTSGQDGVAPMTVQPLRAVYDLPHSLRQGDRHAWRIAFDPMTGPSRMRLRVNCHGEDDAGGPVSWPVLVDVAHLPVDLTRTFG